MNSQFTLGVEEEFQMVDRNTGQLVSHIHTILGKGAPIFGDFIKAETPQCSVELNTHICPNITALRLDLQQNKLVSTVIRRGRPDIHQSWNSSNITLE